MSSENHFSMRDVIKNSWHNVNGAKWAIWAPYLVIYLIFFGAAIVLSIIGSIIMAILNISSATIAQMQPSPSSVMITVASLLVAELIILFLVAPLIAGGQMAALKKLRGESVSGGTGFHYWHKWLPLGFTVAFLTIGSFIISFIGIFGQALVIPGNIAVFIVAVLNYILLLLYATFFGFSILFVADKNKGPFGALGHSAKMASKHWLRIFGLLLFMVIITFLTVLPALLGLLCPVDWVKILGVIVSIGLVIWATIWFFPWYHLILADIFNKLSD